MSPALAHAVPVDAVPVDAVPNSILPLDRRQSPTALKLQRGVRRLFSEMGCATLPEFSLVNGRRADVIALCGAGRLTIVEIKSSVADFRADRKWPDYRDFCDRFFFAIPETVPESLIPRNAASSSPTGSAGWCSARRRSIRCPARAARR